MNKDAKLTHRGHAVVILLGVIWAYIIYAVVMSELPQIMSDYNGHLYVYLPLFSRETLLEGWKAVPYVMWHCVVLFLNRLLHIPLETSAAYSSCIFALFSYFLICWMLHKVFQRLGEEESLAKAGFFAFGLSITQGIYCYWLDTNINRIQGLFSPNPLYNPTQMCVNGFSLLCLCLVYDIWGKQKNDSYHGVFFKMEGGLKKYYIYLAVALFCSVVAKPTFAEMFIPAVGVLMLWNWISAIRKKNGTASLYFKHCLHMFFCAIPALAYMFLQFFSYFILQGSYGSEEANVIITDCMQVWRMFSENIILSIGLGMAFPLFVVLLNPTYFLKKDLGRLALTGYIIGLLEAAFLGESEPKLAHADFIWPMMSGMLLMWVVSLMRLIVLERTQADSGKKKFLIDGAWFLFFVHVLCGYSYIRWLTG